MLSSAHIRNSFSQTFQVYAMAIRDGSKEEGIILQGPMVIGIGQESTAVTNR